MESGSLSDVFDPNPNQRQEIQILNFSAKRLGRNTQRFEEIVRTLGKYGLADLLGDNPPKFIQRYLESSDGEQLAGISREARIRLALTDLGTTFIKLGQILSTRTDFISPELSKELSRLQADTPASPPERVRATIEAELGLPVDQCFSEFDDRALASASIGQVHRARLADGTQVVVKVQHQGIRERIVNDFDILARIASIAETHSSELRLYHPTVLVEQFRRDLLHELDFDREARNLERFRRNFKDDPSVTFPRPYGDLSAERVLTMDFFEGTSVKDLESLQGQDFDLPDIARRGADVFIKMIFEHGFYHADPHPGNLMVLEGGIIGTIDCGMTGRIGGRLRGKLEELLAALVRRSPERLADSVLQFGSTGPELDRQAFEDDIEEFLDDYVDQSLNSVNFGALVGDLMGIIRRHRIQLPASISLLLRMLVVLEGTARLLNPDFSLGEALRPFTQKRLRQKLNPKSLLQQTQRSSRDWARLVEILPREITELFDLARRGALDIHLQHRGLDSTVNRLIYGVLTGALIMGAALLWSREIPPLIGGLSLPGSVLAGSAVFLGFRLLRAIEGVGGLGRRKK